MLRTTVIFALVLSVFFGILSSTDGSNILILSPITTPSHSNFFRPIVKTLADRGHFVTYWNGMEPKGILVHNKTDNLNLLYSPELGRLNSDHQIRFSDRDSPLLLLSKIPTRMVDYCTTIYQDPIFNQLMLASNNSSYDIVIVEGVFNECLLPLIKVLDIPMIYMIGIAPTPWLMDAVGSSLSLDHFPHPGSNYVDSMTVWQRFYNVLSGFFVVTFHRWFIMPVVDRMASKMLNISGQMSAEEIQSQYLSLLISNTHFSINYQMPTSAAEIQSGGLHCVPPNPLPEDLESFVDGSGQHGFIIVSFGSILRGDGIPENVRSIFLSTFARLPQRVIWKWEDKGKLNDDVPSNVRLMSWMPQQDLLGHPKIRLFITHGGLFSNQEAVYHGVPFIVLPVFADQPINAQKAHDDGYAIRLNWDELTEENLYNAIKSILTDPRYAEKMEKVSTLMRDQKEGPLDRAIYWIEYVIRHRGAPHLRTAARKLSLYQRCLVDISFIFTVLALLLGYLFFQVCRYVFHMVPLVQSFFPILWQKGASAKKTN